MSEIEILLNIKVERIDASDKAYIYKNMLREMPYNESEIVTNHSDFLFKLFKMNNPIRGELHINPNIEIFSFSSETGLNQIELRDFSDEFEEKSDDYLSGSVDMVDVNIPANDFDGMYSTHECRDCPIQEYDVITEFVLNGSLNFDNDIVSIEYEESVLYDIPNIKTRLIFSLNNKNIITMIRVGSSQNILTFESGVRNIMPIRNMDAELEISVNTLKLYNNMTAEGGHIEIEYELGVNGSLVDIVRLNIEAASPKNAEQ